MADSHSADRANLRWLPANPLDLLTSEKRAQLDADLREIAACRRRAMREAANLWMA